MLSCTISRHANITIITNPSVTSQLILAAQWMDREITLVAMTAEVVYSSHVIRFVQLADCSQHITSKTASTPCIPPQKRIIRPTYQHFETVHAIITSGPPALNKLPRSTVIEINSSLYTFWSHQCCSAAMYLKLEHTKQVLEAAAHISKTDCHT